MNASHPDIDELSELAEGLLPPSRAAELEAHLGACSDCTELLTAVRAVPALLADVPAPPIPTSVAARLDSVLRAESARRTADADPDESADTDAPPAAPTRIAKRRPRGTWGERHPRLRVAAAAAATVAALGGGVALVGSQLSSTGGSAQSTSAGGAEQMDRSVEEDAVRGQAQSARAREEAYAAKLDALTRRLKARQDAKGVEVAPPLAAAAAAVHGLRIGMAAS